MPYGIIKVDQVTFTNAGVDQTISVSGIVASISGNITATGTISGDVIRGGTLVSGATVTGTAGQFGTITGNTAGFTTVTGTTITGTTLTVASGTFTGNSTAAAFIPTGSTVPTNGVYLPSANNVAISTNGSGRLFVDASGNVGINIASPSSFEPGARNLVVGSGSGDNGLSIYSGTANQGIIYFADGTTTAQKYTGFIAYDHSTNAMRFGTNDGNERLRITSTGALNFVGAGTAGSTQAVSFNGSAPVNSLVIDSSGRLGVGTSSPVDRLHVDGRIAVSTDSSTPTTGEAFFYKSASGAVMSGFGATIETGSAGSRQARVSVDSTGRVGIGTTSPSAPLHVTSSSAGGLVNITSTSTSAALIFNDSGTGGNYPKIGSEGNNLVLRGGALSNAAYIDSSGRLLVGTSSARSNYSGITPYFQFENGSGNDQRSFAVTHNATNEAGPIVFIGKSRGSTVGSNTLVASGDELGQITFNGADGTNMIQAAKILCEVDGTPGANDMPGRLVFSTTADGASSPTERMRITSGGFLKASNTGTYINSSENIHEFITNNSNAYAFRVHHNGTSGQQYGIEIKTANDQNDATRTFLDCFGGGAARIILRSNGGIANYSANNANLSDINTKKDISPAADTWDCIKEWEIVNYRYKDQPDDADLNLGVIAQQVAESCPEVITVFQEAKEATEDAPAQEERLGVKEQQMYWMAIKALQEAQVRIEALEAKVAALEAA